MSRWLQAVGSWFWLCIGGDEVVAEIQGPCARAWPPCPKVEILHEEEIPVKETEIPTYLNVLYLTLPYPVRKYGGLPKELCAHWIS